MAGYGDDIGFQHWLDVAGLTLPAGAPPLAVLRQRGTWYIDAVYGSRLKGTPVGGVAQENAFPRKGLVAYGERLSENSIPTSIVSASYRAAYLLAADMLTMDVSDPTKIVKKEKAEGAGEREYFAPPVTPGRDPRAVDTVIEGLLYPFVEPYPDQQTPMAGVWSVGPKRITQDPVILELPAPAGPGDLEVDPTLQQNDW